MSGLAERTARAMGWRKTNADLAWHDQDEFRYFTADKGAKGDDVWNPKHNANQAMMLLDKMLLDGYKLEIFARPKGIVVHLWSSTPMASSIKAPTVNEAICLAFLRARES